MRTRYRCTACLQRCPSWRGPCPTCESRGTIRQELRDPDPAPRLADVAPDATARLSTGLEALDRVLDGGLVWPSFLVLAGPPGVGKTGLALRLLDATGLPALYATREQTAAVVAAHAARHGLRRTLRVLADPTWRDLADAIARHRPAVVGLDSAGAFGIADATAWCETAARAGLLVVLVAHVTKAGEIAGPSALQQRCDAVLWLRKGKRLGPGRTLILASVPDKNRHGATGRRARLVLSARGYAAAPPRARAPP